MNSLRDALIKNPVSESAGSRSSSAFDYQKDWALAKLIEYHINGEDYVFIFEFHDDVVVLNSEGNPGQADFFQIKTSRNKNWTIGRLTKKDKKSDGSFKLSILGKLYKHKIDFSGQVVKLHFVTDSFFTFNSDSDIFWLNEVNDKDKKQLKNKVKQEHKELNDLDIDDLCFHHSGITLEEHETYIKGKLHDLFAAFFGDNHNISVTAWYKTITGEIKKKNNYPPNNVKSFDDLLRNKCITKSKITEFIEEIKNNKRIELSWDIIQQELIKDDYPTYKLINLKNCWQQFSIERLDSTNVILERLIKFIDNQFRSINLSGTNIQSILGQIYTAYLNNFSNKSTAISEDYVNAIILWKYCERAEIQKIN